MTGKQVLCSTFLGVLVMIGVSCIQLHGGETIAKAVELGGAVGVGSIFIFMFFFLLAGAGK